MAAGTSAARSSSSTAISIKAARSAASLTTSSIGLVTALSPFSSTTTSCARSRLFQKSGSPIRCSSAAVLAFLPARSKRVPQLHDPLLDGFGPINPFSFHVCVCFRGRSGFRVTHKKGTHGAATDYIGPRQWGKGRAGRFDPLRSRELVGSEPGFSQILGSVTVR